MKVEVGMMSDSFFEVPTEEVFPNTNAQVVGFWGIKNRKEISDGIGFSPCPHD